LSAGENNGYLVRQILPNNMHSHLVVLRLPVNLGKTHLTMDAPVTKRLIISGLTPSITADDISRRLTSFGAVKAADGFGLPNGVGETRKFGYVTLETTTGKLAKCKYRLFFFQVSG
jgi:hypothetical protein